MGSNPPPRSKESYQLSEEVRKAGRQFFRKAKAPSGPWRICASNASNVFFSYWQHATSLCIKVLTKSGYVSHNYTSVSGNIETRIRIKRICSGANNLQFEKGKLLYKLRKHHPVLGVSLKCVCCSGKRNRYSNTGSQPDNMHTSKYSI
jgi:hypothetical protein